MQYVKVLGLAVIVAAVMAMFAGSASATMLYKNSAHTETVSAGTVIESHLKAGTKAVLKAGFATVECSSSSINGQVGNAGSSTTTVAGKITKLEFLSSSCNCETKTLANGGFEFHWISGTANITVTFNGFELTVNCFGTDCVYGSGASGLDLGTINAGSVALLFINAILRKLSGGIFCENEVPLTATYEVTNPSGLFGTES